MYKWIAILFLMSVVLNGQIVIGKLAYKQYCTEESPEQKQAKHADEEFSSKFLHGFRNSVSSDLFYMESREKFSHFRQQPLSVEWLETFSPPPELS